MAILEGLLAFAVTGAVTGAVVGASRYFSSTSKLDRKLRKVPRCALADLAEGTTARIVGKAETLAETLEAPLSGRSCFAYEAIVEIPDRRDWIPIMRQVRSVPFILDDGTARAIIDPRGSRAMFDFDRVGESAFSMTRKLAFLRDHGESTKYGPRGYFNKGLRYREGVIEVGETIVLVGEAVREPDPDGVPEAGYRGDAPTRLRMTSSRKRPMIISDSRKATR